MVFAPDGDSLDRCAATLPPACGDGIVLHLELTPPRVRAQLQGHAVTQLLPNDGDVAIYFRGFPRWSAAAIVGRLFIGL